MLAISHPTVVDLILVVLGCGSLLLVVAMSSRRNPEAEGELPPTWDQKSARHPNDYLDVECRLNVIEGEHYTDVRDIPPARGPQFFGEVSVKPSSPDCLPGQRDS